MRRRITAAVSQVPIEGFEIRHFGAGDYGKGAYLRYDDLGAAPDLGAFEQASEIFADGFESGDLTAWSSWVP